MPGIIFQVIEKGKQQVRVGTPLQYLSTVSPLVPRAAGQMYRQTTQFSYQGGVISDADNMPKITRRIRIGSDGSCVIWRAVRMFNADVMETLLYGCVTKTQGQGHFAKLRTAHHKLLLRNIGFHYENAR